MNPLPQEEVVAPVGDSGMVAKTSQSARSGRLTSGFKTAYGIGAVADGLVTAGFGFFLLFYLTAVCGMSGTAAGSAKMIALLVDAVADPAIGLVSDRVRSRWGRRLPFMAGGLLPFAAAFGFLFSIPPALEGLGQFLYVTACLIVLRLSLSFFVLPFTAIGAEVTDDYRERASIVSYRLTFSSVGILCGVVLGLGLFMSGDSGLLERGNYIPYAWTSAAIMMVTGLIAIGAVRSALPRLHGPAAGEASPLLAGFLDELVELGRNRSFLLLFGTVLIYFLAYTTWSSLALHSARYFWNLDAFAIQWVVLSATLGPVLGAPISAFALRYIEKRTLAIAAFLAIALLQMWPPLLHLYGPFDISPSEAAVLLTVNGLLVGTAIMIGGVGFQSMLADTADEHEWLFGVRREGLFFSGLTLAYKGSAALGGLIAGLALDLIRFPTDLAGGAPPVISGEILAKLGLIAGPLPALFAALAPLFLLGYRLTRSRHAQIIAGLEQRHEQLGKPVA